MSEVPHSDIDPREVDPADGQSAQEVDPDQVDADERSGGADSGTNPGKPPAKQDHGQGAPDGREPGQYAADLPD